MKKLKTFLIIGIIFKVVIGCIMYKLIKNQFYDIDINNHYDGSELIHD